MSIHIEDESRFLGHQARVVRLHSGIVAHGRIVAATPSAVTVDLAQPLPETALGPVFIEVYAGPIVMHREGIIETNSGTVIEVEVEARPDACPGERRMWWCQSSPFGTVSNDFGNVDIVVKAVGAGHIAFDAARPLPSPGQLSLCVRFDGIEEVMEAKVLWQFVFAGAVHGVLEIESGPRVSAARWRQLACSIAGIEGKVL